jgi:hypothetical protein
MTCSARLEGGSQVGRLIQILEAWQVVEGARFTGNLWLKKVDTLDAQLA